MRDIVVDVIKLLLW